MDKKKIFRIFYVCVFVASLLFTSSCKKDNLQRSDCERLKQGIIANDIETVKQEINKFCFDFSPGHNSAQDLNTLAESISSQCSINVTVLCFNCVYTNPPMSELKLSFSSSRGRVEKIIDIFSMPENTFAFAAMHKE